MIPARVTMFFYIQTCLESLFVFMGAITNAFAFFALHFDSIILRHTRLKRNGNILLEYGKKRKFFIFITKNRLLGTIF
jgi:hypothetical protein